MNKNKTDLAVDPSIALCHPENTTNTPLQNEALAITPITNKPVVSSELPLTDEQKAAFIELWTEFEPIPNSIEELTKADRKKLNTRIAKNRLAADKLKRKANAYFDSDSKDSEIRDYIISAGIVNNLASPNMGQAIFKYGKDGYWQEQDENAFSPFMSYVLDDLISDGYGRSKQRNVADMVKERLPEVPEKPQGIIGFKNCAFNTVTKETLNHSPSLGLYSVADYPYKKDETDCPTFLKWVTHAVEVKNDDGEIDNTLTNEKQDLLFANLYAVMTNRYDWQFFFETVGDGGTGKSVKLSIETMLVGEENSVALTLEDLECTKAVFGLEPIIGKSLIVIPDAKKLASDYNNLKAISGGDPISINRKGIKNITLRLAPTLISVYGNQPLISTDQSTGLWRRRIIFSMKNKVNETDKDIKLISKLKSEVSAIFNVVLNYFAKPEDAYNVLSQAAKSDEKLLITSDSDPLLRWASQCLLINKSYTDPIRTGCYTPCVKSNQGDSNTIIDQLGECEKLFPNYQMYCKSEGVNRPLALKAFTNSMATLADKARKFAPIKEVNLSGNRKGWIGLTINNEAEHLTQLRETMKNNKFNRTEKK